MAIERTFSIIKPNAVAKNVIGAIYNRFESAGFKNRWRKNAAAEQRAG